LVERQIRPLESISHIMATRKGSGRGLFFTSFVFTCGGGCHVLELTQPLVGLSGRDAHPLNRRDATTSRASASPCGLEGRLEMFNDVGIWEFPSKWRDPVFPLNSSLMMTSNMASSFELWFGHFLSPEVLRPGTMCRRRRLMSRMTLDRDADESGRWKSRSTSDRGAKCQLPIYKLSTQSNSPFKC